MVEAATLQQQLDRIKIGFKASAPAEVVQSIDAVIGQLVAAGVERKPLTEGDPIPSFSLDDTDGQRVSSDELLRHGPAVISFYRGGW